MPPIKVSRPRGEWVAEAVGSEKPHAAVAGRRGQRRFERAAAFGLGKAARHHLRDAHAARRLAQRRRYLGGGDRDKGVIDRLGQRRQRTAGRQAVDDIGARVDRVNLALEPVFANMPDEVVRRRAAAGRGAQHRDAARREQRREAVKHAPTVRLTRVPPSPARGGGPGWGRRPQHDAGVGSNRAGGRHDQRVDVDLGDLVGERREQPVRAAEAHQRVDDRILVGGDPAAGAAQDRAAAQLADHRAGVARPQRADAEDGVAEDLDKDAAEPEHDHRPEARVADAAENQLVARRGHLLDQKAVDRPAGERRRSQHRRASGFDGASIGEPERNAADIALVQDAGGDQL